MWSELIIWISASPYKVLAAALLLGLSIHIIFWFVIGLISQRTRTVFDDALVLHLKAPTRWLLPLVTLHFSHPYFKGQLEAEVFRVLANLLSAATIALVAWVLIRFGKVFEKILMDHENLDKPDNLAARSIYTQVQILRKVFTFIVIVLAAGLILMSFEEFRRIGAGILASAGIVGVIVGFAAQRTLGNLLAGIQIAITQPIRLDDVVVVENEWGVIEEISLTYVVVRIWDLRRLIVPISYFLEKPFQNWTRKSSKVLGTVFLWVDYNVPLDKLRAELARIVERSSFWDKDMQQIVVTNCDQKAMELRVLVSAPTGSLCWDLRVEVREKLLAYIQQNFPQSLPVLRAEIKER
jgi:small-conductance mechanosensitive channel